MSLLIFTCQKQRIITQKASINYKLMMMRNKLMDLQKYASSIADGNVSVNELMNAPSNMFGRMSIFLQYANMTSTIGAMNNFAYLKATGGLNQYYAGAQNQQLNDAEKQRMQAQMEQMVFGKLKEQQNEKVAASETKLLDAQETRMNQQIAQMETQIKMLDSEEQKVTDAESKAAEKSAPGYVA